jgi:pyruvate formate lyase activating enzyme
MQSGLVFNIQRYSIQDGPGIRTTVFLKGCPLRCWWCHNPESQAPEPEITVIETRCTQCGECLSACPQSAAGGFRGTDFQSVDAGTVPILAERKWDCPPSLVRCTRCGACVEACPTEARQLVGRRMTVDEVLAEVLKDRLFYDDSGGGVTFSGGEPLVQPEFLMGLLAACRARAIHTAVDTSGYAPQEQLLSAAGLTDLFLYDLKTMDDARHLECTGVSNAAILENLIALGRVHQNIWIRIPIIPGFNDDAEQLDAAARFVASIPAVRQVSLLPYHPTGIHKSRWLGRHVAQPPSAAKHVAQPPSAVPGHASLGPRHPTAVQHPGQPGAAVPHAGSALSQAPTPPSSEYMEEAANRFRAFGLNTQTGG